jgi:Zn finger protein HypA/HybF involved in hydrogenase expression
MNTGSAGKLMHELSLIKSFVDSILERLSSEPDKKVLSVRMRRSLSMAEEGVRDSFKFAVHGTRLEGAELNLEVAAVSFRCSCGSIKEANEDEARQGFLVCRSCKSVQVLHVPHDMQLLDLVVEDVGLKHNSASVEK